MICQLCPHHCNLLEGQIGRCRARKNENGVINCINYGKLTAMALDPIEKKPLARFYPGSKILSVGSFGCNLHCQFCQNSEISMGTELIQTIDVSPEGLIQKALELVPQGNIGVAFTYNEPLISYEYIRDAAILAHKNGIKTVLVTNGVICKEPLLALLPDIDAMNIDLKGFAQSFYHKVGGELETVKQTIMLAAARCHVEVTALIIPDENDSEEEMEKLALWLSSVDPGIPLHLTRFFPAYQMRNKNPTPVETIDRLRAIAKKYLRYVYVGNC